MLPSPKKDQSSDHTTTTAFITGSVRCESVGASGFSLGSTNSVFDPVVNFDRTLATKVMATDHLTSMVIPGSVCYSPAGAFGSSFTSVDCVPDPLFILERACATKVQSSEHTTTMIIPGSVCLASVGASGFPSRVSTRAPTPFQQRITHACAHFPESPTRDTTTDSYVNEFVSQSSFPGYPRKRMTALSQQQQDIMNSGCRRPRLHLFDNSN